MSENLNTTFIQVNRLLIESPDEPVNNPCMNDMTSRIAQRLEELDWTWAHFARELDASQQRIHNWRKRGTPAAEAHKISQILGVTADWLLTGRGPKEPNYQFQSEGGNARYLDASIAPWDSTTPLGEDEVEVPFFTEVEAAAGAGTVVQIENNGPKLRFSRSTLRRKGVDPDAVACVTIIGNSMEPVIPDGTAIGVDTNDTDIQSGKMYAIDQAGMLRVKVVYKLPNGLRLRSYNSDEWPDEHVTGPDLEQLRVIGRVFWYSVLL